MELELWGRILGSHSLLAGAADTFGPLAVKAACFEVLKFHPNLVTYKSEADRVVDYLTNSTKG